MLRCTTGLTEITLPYSVAEADDAKPSKIAHASSCFTMAFPSISADRLQRFQETYGANITRHMIKYMTFFEAFHDIYQTVAIRQCSGSPAYFWGDLPALGLLRNIGGLHAGARLNPLVS